jgi:hypothetical protein
VSFMGGGGAGVATGPAGGLRFASTRGRIQGSQVQGVNYPSPFFDVAHTYLPVTVKQLFKWCRYYFLTNPLINATVFKLSEYPVTDIIIDHESPEVKKRWTEYYQDHLRWRAFQIEGGLDYHCYGNGCFSLGYPFKKYLYCKQCEFRDEAAKIRANWIFTNFQFRLTCPRCGYVGDSQAQDFYYKNASGIKTIRWNPEDIEINYNDISGEYTYFYTIPAVVRNDIVIGRKDIVEGIPQVFIQAMREQKGVIFSKDNFFHMRRPTLATQDRGWGTPLLLPVLKDTFYLQVMKKASCHCACSFRRLGPGAPTRTPPSTSSIGVTRSLPRSDAGATTTTTSRSCPCPWATRPSAVTAARSCSRARSSSGPSRS